VKACLAPSKTNKCKKAFFPKCKKHEFIVWKAKLTDQEKLQAGHISLLTQTLVWDEYFNVGLFNLPLETQDSTFSADTGHILGRRSRTTRVISGNASSCLLDLPQVACRIITGDEIHQMRAGLRRTAGLPQHLSPPLSET